MLGIDYHDTSVLHARLDMLATEIAEADEFGHSERASRPAAYGCRSTRS